MEKSINIRKHAKWLLLFAILCMGVFSNSSQAKAASNVKRIEAGKVYSTKLTGSKTNKVKLDVVTKEDYSVEAYLYINGKRNLLKDYGTSMCYAELLTVTPKRTLIGVYQGWAEAGANYQIYEYKNNKLKKITSFSSTGSFTDGLSPIDHFVEIKKAGKNQLTVVRRMTVGNGGIVYADAVYKIKGNRFTVSNVFNIRNSYEKNSKVTAACRIKTSMAAGGGKAAFTVKKGEKVTLSKMKKKKGSVYIQIKNSKGKKGWFKVLDNKKYF